VGSVVVDDCVLFVVTVTVTCVGLGGLVVCSGDVGSI
jgi:hypothetical protein